MTYEFSEKQLETIHNHYKKMNWEFHDLPKYLAFQSPSGQQVDAYDKQTGELFSGSSLWLKKFYIDGLSDKLDLT